MSCAEVAEPIDILFGIWTRLGPSKHVVDGDTHWHHLENMVAPSMCVGIAAICHIT